MKKAFLVISFLLPLALYIFTLAPTVTNEDSGDFITSSYVLGIPHPPGYPFYTMLGKIFTYIPLKSIAWRVNAMSAFFAALAVATFYVFLLRFFSPFLSLIVSLTFAFSREFWSQSVIAEVYTLHVFLLVLLMNFSFSLMEKPKMRNLFLAWSIMGLSLTNHHTALLFLPFLIWITFRIWGKIEGRGKYSFFLFFLLPLLLYLYLPIRAKANPPCNWGNPENIKNFICVVTRHQYGGFSTNGWKLDYLRVKTLQYLKLLSIQFSFLYFLGIGFIRAIIRRKEKGMLLFLLFLTYSFFFAFLVSFNPYIRHPSVHIGVFYIPSFLLFSYFIGETFDFLSKYSKRIIYLFLLFPFLMVWVNYSHSSRRGDFTSYNYGMKVLSSVPPKSIVFTNHKDRIFIFWYLQFVQKRRRDTVFLSIESLKRPTYLKRIRKLYPQIKFPSNKRVENFVKTTIEKKYPPMTIVYMIIEYIIEKNINSHPIYGNTIFPQRKFKFISQPPVYRIVRK